MSVYVDGESGWSAALNEADYETYESSLRDEFDMLHAVDEDYADPVAYLEDEVAPRDEWMRELNPLDEDFDAREELESQFQADAEEFDDFLFFDEDEAPTDELEEVETGTYEDFEGSFSVPTIGLATLDGLLELEAGTGSSLASRVRGVAAFALGPALQRGSTGLAVAALQRALSSLGHDVAVDGDFGPNTERAVRAFQVGVGIAESGVVDLQTKTAIATELGRLGQSTAPGPIVDAPSPPPAVELCASIAAVAEQQFRRWRPSGTALHETDPAASPFLQEYYRAGVNVEVTAQQLQSGAYQNSHPWSAVFISWVMRTAGAGNRFPYSRAHQSYIRVARRNRIDGNAAGLYWAYRVTEVAPRVGDLVCAARAGSGATYDNIGDATLRATHCDFVTEVRSGELRVIGGNVSQTVGAKVLRTQANGRIDLSGNQSQFFAVLKCRAGRAVPSPSPTPSNPDGTLGNSLDSRVLQVMELLVSRYGYPVNGAAGIVGNLMSESGVLPNRIEGSRPETPMLARDFNNQWRTFTPEEVRDRSGSAKVGPMKPGIGLAQWTTTTRRSGLFMHVFRGQQLGARILFDLEAQVDYLATELRLRTTIDAVLRSPSVTVNDASDEVVYRFEIPGSVLEPVPVPKPPNFRRRALPRTHPRVQSTFARRRQNSQHALRLHRALHS